MTQPDLFPIPPAIELAKRAVRLAPVGRKLEMRRKLIWTVKLELDRENRKARRGV